MLSRVPLTVTGWTKLSEDEDVVVLEGPDECWSCSATAGPGGDLMGDMVITDDVWNDRGVVAV